MFNKIHVNVGTIGHVDHGKTTLTSALTKAAATRFGGKEIGYSEIDKSPEERRRGITIHATHVEYETAKRHYAHIDCPGHADYVKGMIVGASQMDGAILLVDGTQGIGPQTREHVLLARQVGVEHLVVFINKVDVADAEILDVVELEIAELCAAHGYNAKISRGSALRGDGVSELLDAIDTCIPDPPRDFAAAFLMPVEDVFSIEGRGTVVTGRVARGVLPVGAKVELVGCERDDVVVTGIQAFHRDLKEARAGENVGLLLRGVHHSEVERGVVVATPGSIRPHTVGEAELYVLGANEGGRKKPFGSGYRPQFFFGATDVTGTLDVGDVTVFPGDRVKARFALNRAVGFEPGTRFALREGGLTIGAGVVTAVE
jgi:elongation factor Tu